MAILIVSKNGTTINVDNMTTLSNNRVTFVGGQTFDVDPVTAKFIRWLAIHDLKSSDNSNIGSIAWGKVTTEVLTDATVVNATIATGDDVVVVDMDDLDVEQLDGKIRDEVEDAIGVAINTVQFLCLYE